jgi:hypothetical protein
MWILFLGIGSMKKQAEIGRVRISETIAVWLLLYQLASFLIIPLFPPSIPPQPTSIYLPSPPFLT